MHDPAPHREPQGNERWILLGAFALALGLLLAIVIDDYEPAKLAPLFMLVSWFPLIALHELGHAAAARAGGWRVHEIVVGFGRPAAGFTLLGVPFIIKMYPLGGYVSPGPASMRAVRFKSAFVYAAGPGVEILLAGLIVLVVGPDTLLSHTESIPAIAAQSITIAALLGAGSNLIPRRIQTERGESFTDGMGLLTSLWRPRRHYELQVRATHETRILEATDAPSAITASEEAYRLLGDDPHVRSVMVATLERLDADVRGRALPPRVLERLSP